jgi:hypothetical protein
MRLRPVLIAAMLGAAVAPAVVEAAPSSLRFTVGSSGVTCSMTTASVACQSATSARTVSATLTRNSKVAACSQPEGASPGCVLWPGVVYENLLQQNPEPRVGRFACIPIGLIGSDLTGVVCTVAKTGKGFRITAGKVSRVNQIPPGPHPPCTRAALTVALERAYHKRPLAPSYLSRGWQCAGRYARADLIDVHNGQGDDITVVFRATGRSWSVAARGKICVDGEVPARIWFLACAVN